MYAIFTAKSPMQINNVDIQFDENLYIDISPKAFLKNRNATKNIRVKIVSANTIVFNFLLFENEQYELVKILDTEKYTSGITSKSIVSFTGEIEIV